MEARPVLMPLLLVLLVGVVCLCGIVAVRFLRRGAARYWTAPALALLAMLPTAAGTALSGMHLHGVLSGIALTGSGARAALLAGLAESLAPVVCGLAGSAVLALLSVLLVSFGFSRTEGGVGSGGLLGSLAAPVLLLLTLGFAVFFERTVRALHDGLSDPAQIQLRFNVGFYGSLGVALLVGLGACVLASVAPRGAAPPGIKAASLATLGLALLGTALVLAPLYRSLVSITEAAMLETNALQREIEAREAAPPEKTPSP